MFSRLMILLSVAALLASMPGLAHSQHPVRKRRAPVRNGFTLELGIGVSFMHVLPKSGSTLNKVGLAPLSLSLGGFVNNDLAVMFRMTGGSWFRENAFGNLQSWVMGFYGVHVQYWFNDWFFVSGGPGFTLYGSVVGRTSLDGKIKAGGGINVRTGFSVATWENHSLRFSLELFGSFFQGLNVVAETIIFEWQWF